jgi:hypothetical protein
MHVSNRVYLFLTIDAPFLPPPDSPIFHKLSHTFRLLCITFQHFTARGTFSPPCRSLHTRLSATRKPWPTGWIRHPLSACCPIPMKWTLTVALTLGENPSPHANTAAEISITTVLRANFSLSQYMPFSHHETAP